VRFLRSLGEDDPQRAYGAGETPPDLAQAFLGEIDRHLDDRL
jgi:hypothetical protein